MDDGTPICVRVVLRKLNSIKVLAANKKLVEFTVCDPSGQPIATLRALPWRVDNMREIALAVRNLFQARFPHDLLGRCIAAGWLSAGGRDELPLTVYVGELPDGSELGIRFDEVSTGSVKDCDQRTATASIIINDRAIPLKELLPPMLRKICPGALDEESFAGFVDMQDSVVTDTHQSWLFKRLQRYDFLSSFQSRYEGKAGIIPAMLQGGEQVEVFHTGDYSSDGSAIYGLCRSRSEGRWTNIVWAFGDQLRAVGINRLPQEPDWNIEWHAFDPCVTVGTLSRHVLDHAHRWCMANPAALTGKKDVLGHDVFVDDASRETMYAIACEELNRSLRCAAENPATVVYGYYHAAVDRTHGDYSPIALYLPAHFSDQAKSSGEPDAFFALRVVKEADRIRYEVPTILAPFHVRRTMSVLGDAMMAA